MRRYAKVLLWLTALGSAGMASAQPTVSSARCENNDCRLWTTITVQFSGLNAWITGPPAGDVTKLELALNGNLLKGVYPKPHVAGAESLEFYVVRTADNRATWNVLLSKAGWDQSMTVSVGPDNGTTLFAQTASPIVFHVLPAKRWVWAGVIFLGVLVVGFLILAVKSNIVRDPADLGADFGSFSLARSQMAWWLFIVVGSYGYIFAITGDIDTITQGVLVLIGISAGAGLGAMVMDGNKQTQRKTLETEQATLATEITQLTAQIAGAPVNVDQLKATLAQKQARAAEIPALLKNLPEPTAKSRGFLLDILSDDSGVNFHRFQMAVWTLVVGIIFVHEVWSNLAMPDFSATLLGLMGISSGTYLGFKIPDSPK